MNTMTFTGKQLKALFSAAASDLARPYITHMALVTVPGCVPALMATDSYRLIAYMPTSMGYQTAIDFLQGKSQVVGAGTRIQQHTHMIRRDHVESALKLAGTKKPITLTWSNRGYELEVDEQVWVDTWVEGEYPRTDSLWGTWDRPDHTVIGSFSMKFLKEIMAMYEAMPVGTREARDKRGKTFREASPMNPVSILGGPTNMKPHVFFASFAGTDDQAPWTLMTLLMPVRPAGESYENPKSGTVKVKAQDKAMAVAS